MAQLARTSYALPPIDYSKAQNWGETAHDKAFAALVAASDALPPGQIVGGMLSFPRGDGYAHYLVVKDKPLTVQHVRYSDAYQVDYMTIRGLRKTDVEWMLERRRRSPFRQGSKK